MRSAGIVRKVDELGRIVLPKELRDTKGIKEGAPLEIFVEGKFICLLPYEPGCIFCDEVKNIVEYKGKCICRKCMDELQRVCEG